MPELPEVETVRRGLAEHVVGRRVERVAVGRPRVVRRTSPEALVDGLSGCTVLAAGRRGKYLLLPLDSGEQLMIHLRMSGQLLLTVAGTPRPRHTHVTMTLDDGNELLFVDPRTFGEVVVFDPADVATALPEVARLGIDPVADAFGRAELASIVRRSPRRALKPLLLDQHVIAGIGNIYADEILHAARLRPDRPAGSLRPAAIARLHGAVAAVLDAAVAARGSSLGDAQYVDLMGGAGSYQHRHRVYGRAGERCPTCGRGRIRRVVAAGRGTHFCPVCQR